MEVLEEKLDCPPIQKEREIEGKERKNSPLLPNEKEVGRETTSWLFTRSKQDEAWQTHK